jgi:hypothetical protein
MTSTTADSLTGAALKVALSGLGLPPTWFAQRMNVTMRTVVRWFDGGPIPPEVGPELEKLSELTVAEMLKMVEAVDDTQDPIVLKTYRVDREFKTKQGWPAEWHRQLCFRVKDHFESEGRAVTIEFH